MACQLCHTHLTLVHVSRETDQEVYQFMQQGFHHIHDPNLIRALWTCPAGHDVVRESLPVCLGCTLENQHNVAMEQLALTTANNRTYGGMVPRNDFDFSGFDPVS